MNHIGKASLLISRAFYKSKLLSKSVKIISSYCLTYYKPFLITIISLSCQKIIRGYINFSVIILLVNFVYLSCALYAFAANNIMVIALD